MHSGLREGVKRTFRFFLGTIQDMTLVEDSFEAYSSGEHKQLGIDIGFRVLGGHEMYVPCHGKNLKLSNVPELRNHN